VELLVEQATEVGLNLMKEITPLHPKSMTALNRAVGVDFNRSRRLRRAAIVVVVGVFARAEIFLSASLRIQCQRSSGVNCSAVFAWKRMRADGYRR
jgi:hypothetical protein